MDRVYVGLDLGSSSFRQVGLHQDGMPGSSESSRPLWLKSQSCRGIDVSTTCGSGWVDDEHAI